MEPRIQTLLSASSPDRNSQHLPPPAIPRRPPLPVEPSAVGEEPWTNNNPNGCNDYIRNEHLVSAARPQLLPRQKSSVPIAEVLNDDGPTTFHNLPPVSTNNPPPFSGRLADLITEPDTQRSKRRKLDGARNELNSLTLPKPPPLKKNVNRRHLIPPLLQGLHHPPPLPPQGRLFPPITEQRGDLGDRLRSPVREAGRHTDRARDNEPVLDRSEGNKGRETQRDQAGFFSHKDIVEGGERIEENQRKSKEKAKRNKWTEEETKDLLRGVSRFGIGSWKRILKCPDYTFHGRTAVDLKDRFRTCCGDNGKNSNKKTGTSQDSEKGDKSSAQESNGRDKAQASDPQPPEASSASANPVKKAKSKTDRVGAAKLAELGIDKPFEKSKRRDRKQFTDKDDENLLKGFERHGSVWHFIRSDPELGFQSRHPTDLRDRFRIKYPEKYAQAGYKLKPKDAGKQKEKTTITDSSDKRNARRGVQDRAPPTLTTSAAWTAPSSGTHTLLPPPVNNYSSSFDDFGDRASEDDADGSYSPITLSRNIFDWADANNYQTNTTLPSLSADINPSFLSSIDSANTNSQTAFKPPTKGWTSATALAVTSSYNNTINPLSTLQLPPALALHSNYMPPPPASTSSTTLAPISVSSARPSSNINPRLLTPNLPTIIIPNVPAASARSAMHNLPRPAELLSGLDRERERDVRGGTEHQSAVQNTQGQPGEEYHSRWPNVAGLEEGLGERSLLNSSVRGRGWEE
ncbi:hypothetical protein GQ43DRAFT_445369 [Delitschia confertaspora ATCC 74209]|uniref:Myb-like DNA-binding domain protein n=1 Tax=Delitschia confertaspora ATCC 74209 TaxID=1513339 RepID=A0A9P4JAX6_9PLEO|nr:hypothetical protein GQ43DRAFT_445369 [Delitschia confertaspora ATCC 74209]